MQTNRLRGRRCAVGAAVCSLLIAMSGGCGDGVEPPPGTVKVSGRVTIDGEPLSKGTVTFQPLDDGSGKLRRPAIGEIQSDGTYQLGTFTTGDGALPGEYSVLVTSYKNDPTAEEYDQGVKRESAIPEKYSNALTSGLTASVPETADAIEENIELSSK